MEHFSLFLVVTVSFSLSLAGVQQAGYFTNGDPRYSAFESPIEAIRKAPGDVDFFEETQQLKNNFDFAAPNGALWAPLWAPLWSPLWARPCHPPMLHPRWVRLAQRSRRARIAAGGGAVA